LWAIQPTGHEIMDFKKLVSERVNGVNLRITDNGFYFRA
jgi:hypothetical protein